MIAQQRKELRNQIQTIKKTLPNLDKKAKKQAQEQIRQLEAQIDGLASEQAPQAQPDELLTQELPLEQKKPNRQQLRKQRKDAEMEQMRQEAASEPVVDKAALEREQLEVVLNKAGLQIHQIQADGNCLFNALSHQLSLQQVIIKQSELRQRAVDVMLRCKEEYEPFATDEHGNPTEDFNQYCQQMSSTAWGGHLEIQALSKCLGKGIKVYHADGTVNPFGQSDDGQSLLISYHEFQFGLGSHYNSLVRSQGS